MMEMEDPMRNTIVVMTSILLLVLAIGASANTAARIRAYIPFDFHVGEELLPAGNYIFELRAMSQGSSSSSLLAVNKQDGTLASLVPTMPAGWDYRRINECRLHFTRISDAYFLAKVEAPESGAVLGRAKVETELRARKTGVREKVILVQR